MTVERLYYMALCSFRAVLFFFCDTRCLVNEIVIFIPETFMHFQYSVKRIAEISESERETNIKSNLKKAYMRVGCR